LSWKRLVKYRISWFITKDKIWKDKVASWNVQFDYFAIPKHWRLLDRVHELVSLFAPRGRLLCTLRCKIITRMQQSEFVASGTHADWPKNVPLRSAHNLHGAQVSMRQNPHRGNVPQNAEHWKNVSVTAMKSSRCKFNYPITLVLRLDRCSIFLRG
jgi:hypothetical protein